MGLEEYKGVYVFAQQVDNQLSGIAFELLGKARDLAKDLNTDVTAVLLGKDIKANNGNTLGTDVEYAFTVKTEEPDQPAPATFLQRVQAFFNGLIEKFMAFVRAITNSSYISIFTVLKNTLITLFNRLFPKVA